MEPVPLAPVPVSFESAMNIIFRWKVEPALGYISNLNCSEIHQYLQAVNVILESQGVADRQSEANEAIGVAVARLKHEFLNILNTVTATAGEDVTMGGTSCMTESFSVTLSSSMSTGSSGNEVNPPTNNEAIDNLHNIAQIMINSTRQPAELIDVYTSVRKSFLVNSLKRYRIQKLSPVDKRGLVLDEFKKQIDVWIHASKVFYKILFPREKKLAWQIFDASVADVCFAETVKDAKFQLKNFAEALITSRRSPDKLFKLLDLYKELVDIWPPLTYMNFSAPLIGEAEPIIGLYFQLVEVVRVTLSDFENALVHEVSPIEEASRTIHFLTKYVMDYIRHIVDYDYILSTFILSNPPTCFGDLRIPDLSFAQLLGQTPPLALHVVLIIVVLRFKLEFKSKSYKDDASLVNFFMTNNLHYIIQTIKGLPKLEAMVGEEYITNLSEYYLKEARTGYEKSTCDRMLHCLRDDKPSKFLFSGVSAATLRRRIKSFNTLFEGIRSTQARWVVPDSQLREEIRVSIVEKLVPAYKSFLERFNSRLGRGKHPYIEKTYVKYTGEELQALICKDFFLGTWFNH